MSLIAKCYWIVIIGLLFTSNTIAIENNSQNTWRYLNKPINEVDYQNCEKNLSGYPCLKNILYGIITQKSRKMLKINSRRNQYRM